MYDVLVTDDFSIKAEVDEFYNVAIHVEVFNWNHTIRDSMIEYFTLIKEAFRLEGFKYLYSITPNPRFAKLMNDGWKSVGEYEGNEVLIWELD